VTRKVLIVDDDAHIRLLLAQTLDALVDQGLEITTAADGGAALEAIRRERPALVLLDVMMPVMNGFDVCRAVKSDPELASTFVVLITAKGQGFDRETGAGVGTDRYLTKPFDPEDVLALAAEALGLTL
jgi:DNA-binding response OmpR family regulator